MDTEEEDRKLPATTMLHNSPQKRREANEEKAVTVTTSGEEIIDIATVLGIQIGDRIEVKWIVKEDESEAETSASAESTSVWWPATLNEKTSAFHTLTDEERDESTNCTLPLTSVKVPIYQLNYAPLKGQ